MVHSRTENYHILNTSYSLQKISEKIIYTLLPLKSNMNINVCYTIQLLSEIAINRLKNHGRKEKRHSSLSILTEIMQIHATREEHEVSFN